jgi:tetratricopeptide (TPR) repeat protein
MIYTFYSYKGGVGRSMALANIAELLYAQGLSVLMVDWDLEAPGLERYFPVQLAATLRQPGIADIIANYKRLLSSPFNSTENESPAVLELPDLTKYFLDVHPDERTAGRLRLMPAGRRDEAEFESYGRFVRTFDWEDFYQNWEGEAFVEWFRQQVNHLADVVLVDSRTGMTEMGGICTYQLADAIVMYCGPNAQSIDGTFKMATAFKDPHVVELRRGRPLEVLVVPARVEDRAEVSLLGGFQRDFLHQFGRNCFFAERALAASSEDMWELRIPYVAFYSFRETVMVREAERVRHSDMYKSFTRIMNSLARLAPEDSALRQWGEAQWAVAERAGPSTGIFNLPRQTRRLMGRETLLQQIEGALGDPEENVQAVALTGLGGVGTTSLAIEYAHRHRNDYTMVWWIRADDEATLHGDFAGLAAALRLPEASSPDPRASSLAVHAWLKRHSNWLLVFDNASDPGEVATVLPPIGGGHALITSRNPGWQAMATVLAVDVLPRGDSVDFLLERTGDADTEAARALAEVLGDLPLALEQAAAYVEQSGLSLARYLALFRERSTDLLRRGSAGSNPDTVATVWQLSFERLRDESPAGAAVLRLCAFMAPDDIPLEIFQAPADSWPDELRPVVTDPLALSDAVVALRRYSLIRVSEDDLSVHRLVQAVVRQRLSEESQRDWAGLAVLILAEIFPAHSDDVVTWPTCSRLLPHVLAVTEHAERIGVYSEQTSWLLDRAAAYLTAHAEFSVAKRCLERAVSLVIASRGPADPALCGYLTGLGDLLRELGDLKAAEERYRAALAVAESSHGPDSPEMAAIFLGMGHLLRILGRFDEATESLQRALAISQTVNGPDHPATAAALSQLGRVFAAQGKLSEAENHFARALAITDATYGPGRPEVAVSLSDLGRVVTLLGRPEEAMSSFERALAIAEATYGPDHPRVSPILDDLGKVLCELGRPSEARARHERALSIDEKAYGPDHLNVAADHRNLGTTLCELGDLDGARYHVERALVITESALGKWHPGVADIRNELGRVFREYGDLNGAREQFEQVLSILRRNDLSDHPDGAYALTNLGRVFSQVGDLDAARSALEKALAASERLYGSRHPEVAAALANLGRVLEQLHEFEAAKSAYQRALDIGSATYGSQHPDVADYLDHLGLVLNELGDAREARRCIERAVNIFEAAFGPRHPSVAVVLVHLGGVISDQGNLPAAEFHLRRALKIWLETYGAEHPSAVRTRELLEQLQRRGTKLVSDRHFEYSAQLTVRIVPEDGQPGDDLQAILLREELLDLDVDAVDPVRVEDAPGGTKGIALHSSMLMVTVSRSPATLLAVLDLVADWLRRRRWSKSVQIELDGEVIELRSASAEKQRQLIDAWIARHSRQS